MIKKIEINTKNAPAVIGPYSQAIRVGNFLFCSGQIGVIPKTNNLISEKIEEQTKQILDNLSEVLKEGGSSIDDVVKTTVFLKNMDDFVKMNEVYGKFFKKPYPGRATVEVSKLPRDVLVEIECIAVVGNTDKCCENCC